jgi:hypothetical protein
LFFGNSEPVSAEISSNWASLAGHKVKETLPSAPNPTIGVLVRQHRAFSRATSLRLYPGVEDSSGDQAGSEASVGVIICRSLNPAVSICARREE